MLQEYISFLKPEDDIQKIFFWLIAGLFAITVIWIILVAKKKNWEYNWLGETPDSPQDDLDVEHGSVFDLSDAIATRGEKFAAVLPSMLLIIGLMGTFLGVGFSLNEAAKILSKGDDPGDTLHSMMPMLNGMGAQFKSSIYGIFFFFLFSAFRSVIGSEKKRLKFCIEKCNELIAKKRREEKDPIINALEGVSKSLGNSLQDVLIKVLNEGMLHISESLNGINEKLGETIQKTLSKGFRSVTENLTEVANKTAETTNSLNSLNATMVESFQSVEKSAREMGDASTSLKKSVDEFTPSVQATLNKIQERFVKSIEESGKVMEGAGVSIKGAVEEMARETSDGQAKLRESLATFQNTLTEIMGKIAGMTKDIGGQARNSQAEMSKIREEICNRLGSISSSNVTLKDAIEKMPFDELKEFLAESMRKMKESGDDLAHLNEQRQAKKSQMNVVMIPAKKTK